MTDPKVYQDAARRVDRGWTRRQFYDGAGRVCLVGSIDRHGTLTAEESVELDATLRRYPLYGLFKIIQHLGNPRLVATNQDLIQGWNDVPWRRQATVSKALRRTAKSVEKGWLRDEQSVLRINLANVTHERDVLRERVARLEQENAHLWSRLTSARQLKEDHQQLVSLDAELEGLVKELERL